MSWCVTASRDPILLARPLLSSTQGDLRPYSTPVKQLLKELAVSVKGLISDGEETNRSAVAFVFPEIPHQLCHFHAPLGCHCPPSMKPTGMPRPN